MNVKIDELDWMKMNSLIPVITQEANTKEVLTLAFVNREALERTMETGWAYYYRRSHGKVMQKGVTSGNVQRIVDILTDCDNDALVYLVEQTGPACHLGERTCFHKQLLR
ncbi:phosphoribosyl-AMP cyclohydrolase [Candidatus Bathyarchaeota archaeon]|jgi:phosphoribosyl-AMP cyclohydrolase|nr:MAG: phosphoribosyl-AMP cyclohydrolase [Candidatus Bathyarchaeota archaeon]